MRRWVVLWIASLVVVAVLASVLTAAQNASNARVLSGSDIGFRVEGLNRAGGPSGTLVVRINGNWVEVTQGVTAGPALSH